MKIVMLCPIADGFVGGAAKYGRYLHQIIIHNGYEVVSLNIPSIFNLLGSGSMKKFVLNIYFLLRIIKLTPSTHVFHIIANSYFVFASRYLHLIKKRQIIDVRSHSFIKHLTAFTSKSDHEITYLACSLGLVNEIEKKVSTRCKLIYPPMGEGELVRVSGVRTSEVRIVVYIGSDDEYKLRQLKKIADLFVKNQIPIKWVVFLKNSSLVENWKLHCCEFHQPSERRFSEHLSQAHALLVLGRSEGFPRVIIEARMNGLYLIVPSWLEVDIANFRILSYSSYSSIEEIVDLYDYYSWTSIAMPDEEEYIQISALSIKSSAKKYAFLYEDIIVNN
jgi:hypothetical protein